MKYGYARVSTVSQELVLQLQVLVDTVTVAILRNVQGQKLTDFNCQKFCHC
ncbi:hypothetical protein [Rummeliibacillus stabekisii]|uniref:hypothetical protein n=1 Tax=Rummeliibacillus stabekisii TaxID=241244 RepID=UPI003721D7E4